jgi:hypothetical protein
MVASRMTILQVEHRVRDYDAWKQAFDGDPVGRQQGGVRRYRIMRPTDDPNLVVIELEFDDPGQAEAFQARLRELWGRMGTDLGLESPHARILDLAESQDL